MQIGRESRHKEAQHKLELLEEAQLRRKQSLEHQNEVRRRAAAERAKAAEVRKPTTKRLLTRGAGGQLASVEL